MATDPLGACLSFSEISRNAAAQRSAGLGHWTLASDFRNRSPRPIHL